MDPVACFVAFVNAVNSGELQSANEHSDNYATWMEQGGFPAEFMGLNVLFLDTERDRVGLGNQRIVEKWVSTGSITTAKPGW